MRAKSQNPLEEIATLGKLSELEYLDVRGVAALFHVTPRTVQNWMAEENEEIRLEGFFLGNKWLFGAEHISAFIKKRQAYAAKMASVRQEQKRARVAAARAVRQTSGEMPAIRVNKTKEPAGF
jgi:hypothetical protein